MFNTFTYSRSLSAVLAAGAATLWIFAASAQTMQAAPQAPVQYGEESYPETAYPQAQPQTVGPQGQAMPWGGSAPQGQQAQTQQAPVYGQEYYQGQGSTDYQGQEGYHGQQQASPDRDYRQQEYRRTETVIQQQGAGVVPQTMPDVPQRSQTVYQERTHTRVERYIPPVEAAPESRMQRKETLTPLPGERAADQQAAVNNPGNVRFMTGGIGLEEREQFIAAANEFPVKLSFANRTGAFLSNVDVTITDSAGQTVLGLRTQGPILLVDLKPGNYKVQARDNGEVINRNITVSSSPRSYTMHFPTGKQDFSS